MSTTNQPTPAVNPRPGSGVIGPVRLSYLAVFAPRVNSLRKDKNTGLPVSEYSAVLLIPKEASTFCPAPADVKSRVEDLIKEALIKKFSKAPAKWESPLKDGDVETDNDGNAKYPGYFYVNVREPDERAPILVDGQKMAVTGGWKSGDWGKVSANFYGYEFEGKKGVSSGFSAIQFLKQDEPLGSVIDAETVLAGFGTEDAEDEFDPFAEL